MEIYCKDQEHFKFSNKVDTVSHVCALLLNFRDPHQRETTLTRVHF